MDIDAGHGAVSAQSTVIRCTFGNGDKIVTGGNGGRQIIGVAPALDAAVTYQSTREIAA